VSFKARDGLRIEGNLFRPSAATGARRARVPTVVFIHGGYIWQSFRSWLPFKQVLVREVRRPRRRLPWLDWLRPGVPAGQCRRVGHADVYDCIDAGRWRRSSLVGRAAGRPRGSYGGYLTLCALVDEPAMWTAGSTSTAIRRSPRATTTATARAGWTCTG
jgi:dipeptidyl aminopeptidase/acylaminoacyl peptidase